MKGIFFACVAGTMGVSICMLSTSVYPLHQCGFLLTTWDTFGLAIPENFHGGKILYLFFVQLLYVSSTSSLLHSVSFVSPHDVELNMRCSEEQQTVPRFRAASKPSSCRSHLLLSSKVPSCYGILFASTNVEPSMVLISNINKTHSIQ